jgi:hypothetical protein
MIKATGKTSAIGPYAALFVRESSGSFATIAAARPSVQPGASSASDYAGRATAAGYGDCELPDGGSDMLKVRCKPPPGPTNSSDTVYCFGGIT